MAEHGESENHHGPTGDAAASSDSACVFISYASHDAAVAERACLALEAAGLSCWMAPRDVVPGMLYADGIVRAINDSKVFALILSEHAVASPHVGKELERASSKRHPVIALRTDAAPLTPAFEYFLNESQWIKVGAGGTGAAIAQLVGAVRRHLLPESATEPTHSPKADTGPRTVATSRRSWTMAVALFTLALAAAYLLADKVWRDGHSASPARVAAGPSEVISDKSIAVLPFADMSEKKDQEYFADGVAEEIIDLLVKIPSLKVIGRTSSFQFKGKNEDLRTIGTTLGAAYLVEGSVRKSGDRLRVTAQLIDSHDGTHRWSNTFDREMGDILKMQDEIAIGLVRSLELTISPADMSPRLAIRNYDAYDELLRGRYAFDQWNAAGLKEAEIHFRRALDLDPTSAVAAAQLAAAYDAQGEWGILPPRLAFEQARSASEAAIKLDPTLALPHTILASIHIVYDWDWSAAKRENQEAMRLAPREPLTLLFVGKRLMAVGHFDEALTYGEESLAQDPLSPTTLMGVCWIQQRLGHLAEAEAACRRIIEISPAFSGAHFYLGIVLLARGQREAALAEMQRESIDGGQLDGLAMAYYALGRSTESSVSLARMLKIGANDYPFAVAEVYAYRGEVDAAMQWLDRAYAQKDSSLYLIKGDPPLKNLESDPRFKAFLRKMNLPE